MVSSLGPKHLNRHPFPVRIGVSVKVVGFVNCYLSFEKGPFPGGILVKPVIVYFQKTKRRKRGKGCAVAIGLVVAWESGLLFS